MMKDKPLFTANYRTGKVACGLLTKDMEIGAVTKNWLEDTTYNNSTLYAVKYAQRTLNPYSDEKVKSIWLRIEKMCSSWRRQKGFEIRSDTGPVPIKMRVLTTGPRIYNIARDGELFSWLLSDGADERTPDCERELRELWQEYGPKVVYSAMLLYENYYGFDEDVHGSFQSLLALEAHTNEENAKTGKKIKTAAKLGHEAVYGTTQEKEAKRAEYQKYVNALHSTNRRLSFSDLKRKAAEHFKVSPKTISRYVTNPKKGSIK